MHLKQSTAIASLILSAACASEPESSSSSAKTGVTGQAEELVFRTDTVQLKPGEERYLCFASTLDHDLTIDGYAHDGKAFVHHIVFSRALAPEPAGFSECDTLFRMTWDPLFITGAGNSKLDFPAGAAHRIGKGTQLVAQLHLLNNSDDMVEAPVEIKMHESSDSDPTPVGTYVFGSTEIDLPASKAVQVQGDCALTEDLQLIAAFPHMHRLGTKMRFEAGSSLDTMQSMYSRDPFDFDDQHIEAVDISLKAGGMARVTCNYDNTTVRNVEFGESTNAEMCFFIASALGRSKMTTCLQGSTAGHTD
jgi:plastocyanin